MEINPKYNPKEVEDRWYEFWIKGGYFTAESPSKKEPFCMVIPPPNITGSLHMGHALNNTIQDILSRWKRMQGYNVLWLPGTDHAGIATQNVVERDLKKEGLTRQQVGREQFIERVWKWRDMYGTTIINQLKKLGCSCDWSRTRFTMDEGFTKAVQEEFVTLYKQGLIYRGDYIINWCPRCQTALSDLEAEHKDINGYLYYVKYPLVYSPQTTDHSNRKTVDRGPSTVDCIIVATTRPETIFGDIAIAVNPKDKRYKNLVGKKVKLPGPCGDREIPIIADDYVDVKFGTGCLKITPAHDPADFEIGTRHKLETIKVIGPDGKMNEFAGKYKGMDRFECRKMLVEDLTNEGCLEKTEDYKLSIGSCYRCHTFVEPYLSKQWFVNMKELAKPAIKAVKDGKVKFVPKNWEKTYYQWMDNIRDWCISRQIWWGHRIPVWYCENEKCRPIVSASKPEKCPCCESVNLRQDEDVLDTWFSSDLWPFGTLGWPDKTDDLKTFYPTSVLSTAFDIIFFWVARMIIMGMHFMGDVPFNTVYIHALVRDPEGQKMSKSKGNVIDPLAVLDTYGTDALRFTLAALAVKGRDIFLSDERIQGYRNFMNKIWNASRFILMNMQTESQNNENAYLQMEKPEGFDSDLMQNNLMMVNSWILSRLNKVTNEITKNLENYNFDKASLMLYEFFWRDFCDWYLEISKLNFAFGLKQSTVKCLNRVLEQSLRLMHPFMPFITEEIWQNLKTVSSVQYPVSSEKNKTIDDVAPSAISGAESRDAVVRDGRLTMDEKSIMVSEWPKFKKEEVDQGALSQMELVKEIVTAIRSIRSELSIHPGAKLDTFFVYKEKGITKNSIKIFESNIPLIWWLAGLKNVEKGFNLNKPKQAAATIVKGIEIYIPLEGLIDIQMETERLKKELEKAERELATVKGKLANKDFAKRAPAEIVEKEKEKKAEAEAKLKKIKENIKILG